jgi:hypothetical protein
MALAIWHAAWTLPRQISFQLIVEKQKRENELGRKRRNFKAKRSTKLGSFSAR